MIDPGIKKEAGYSVYDDASRHDLLVKTENNEEYVGPVWPGDCVFPDFTMPETRAWWASLYPPFLEFGTLNCNLC